MTIDGKFKEIFSSSQLMIAFRKNKNLKQLIGTNTIRNNQKQHLQKQQLQVSVSHVTPVDRFAVSKFSKQQHLQALKPGRPLQFFIKSLAIVTMSSAY